MKKIIALLLALSMVFALVACGNKPAADDEKPANTGSAVEDAVQDNNKDNVGESTEVKEAATIRESFTMLDSAPSNLDPTAMNSGGANWLWMVYEMPYQVDGFGGDLVPVLADSTKGSFKPGMDHEAGSNEYILYIQKGIKDHAGNELKASDVVFSYDLLIGSGNARGMNTFDKAEVVDDYTVKLTFKRELNLVGELVTYFARVFFVSEASYKASPTGFVSDACGTGPYKLESFTSGSGMTLVMNEDYWCPADKMTNQIQKANIKTINYVYASEPTSMVVALGTGEANATSNLSMANAGDFLEGGKHADKFDVHVFWDNLTNCILPNCHPDSVTGNEDMRKAIFYAVSVEGITAALAADVPGSWRECYGMGNPNFSDFSENWAKWENYQTVTDIAKSKEYQQKAGYNGETIEIIAMAGDTETIAVVVSGMLDQAGIKSHITLVDRSTQNVVKGDPAAWNISIEAWASSDFIVNVWDKLYKSNNDQGFIAQSGQFIKDDEFLAMCLESKTLEGHTQENVDKVQAYMIEKAYCMGLTQKCTPLIYPSDIETLYLTDKNAFVCGASTFKGE